MIRLAIVSTHPIQYYAPLFRRLARLPGLTVRVFFTWSQTQNAAVFDPDFGKSIAWDVPLLDGYPSEFVPNTAAKPGSDHFWGIRNPGLVGAIEAWRPQAILVFGWNNFSHLRAMLHFKGRIPVFFRGDSTLLDPRPASRVVARRILLRWIYRHVDVAIAVGSNNRDYFLWCGVPEERITVAPHAIDIERFQDSQGAYAKQAAVLRQELGIPQASRVVVFAGKFHAKKDPLLLLEAFVRSESPGHLVFAGSGVLESELRSRAANRRDVHFLPFQNQQAMPAVYRLADVFVLPSRGPGETWGLALNEAMACGRAVIASSRVGGARDLVRHRVNGWVFEASDLDALTTVVREALTCEIADLRAMGEAAARESANWSMEAAAHGIESAVRRFAVSLH
jgi:glycosyltransferase involved in cell wall biosynthesis